jgi:hypothetical protein
MVRDRNRRSRAWRALDLRRALRAGGQESRTRSLAQVNRKLRSAGVPIEDAIAQQLDRRRTVSVLEIGFGRGRS